MEMNPGSPEAFDRGCTCPIVDNNQGQGITRSDGKRAWWISGGCPLHDPNNEENGND